MTLRQPHFVLAAQPGWRDGYLDHVVLAGGGDALELQRIPGPPVTLVDSSGSLGGFVLPAAVAVDSRNRIYILDAKTDLVKRFDPCTAVFEALSCVGATGGEPRQLRGACGMAISSLDDLYIADTGNRRLQVFAIEGLALKRIVGPLEVVADQRPWRIKKVPPLPSGAADPTCRQGPDWPDGTWLPWDVAVAQSGASYVSDYANGLVHVFDCDGVWLCAYDGSAGGWNPLSKPTRLAIDACGRIYVVQEGADYVTILAPDGSFIGTVRDTSEVSAPFCPVAVAVDASGTLHICDSTGSLLLFTQAAGSFVAAGRCPAPGQSLAFDSSGNPVLADAGTHTVIELPAGAAYETDGTYISQSLDSRSYQCEWDRVELLATVPPGTQVYVDTYTSESDKPLAEVRAVPEDQWATGQVDSGTDGSSWDCTILSPPGRYLWLRLRLIGRGLETASISRARVLHMRASSRQFLPAVFSEEPISRGFLDRFLSIFDTIRKGISSQVDEIASYFDAGSTPADAAIDRTDFLSWLASWIGLTIDRHWPVEKRRRLLEKAYLLYQLRGTPAGLKLHVQLYTGIEPRILEHFTLRRWLFLGESRLGDQAQIWGADVMRRLQLDEFSSIGSFQLLDSGDPLTDPLYQNAHRFTLFVPLPGSDPVQRLTLERIVQLAKPAHTEGVVQIVEPKFRVGCQAFVGVDTVIGQYPTEAQLGAGLLGQDTVLGSFEDGSRPLLKVGSRSRIGSSTVPESRRRD